TELALALFSWLRAPASQSLVACRTWTRILGPAPATQEVAGFVVTAQKVAGSVAMEEVAESALQPREAEVGSPFEWAVVESRSKAAEGEPRGAVAGVTKSGAKMTAEGSVKLRRT